MTDLAMVTLSGVAGLVLAALGAAGVVAVDAPLAAERAHTNSPATDAQAVEAGAAGGALQPPSPVHEPAR